MGSRKGTPERVEDSRRVAGVGVGKRQRAAGKGTAVLVASKETADQEVDKGKAGRVVDKGTAARVVGMLPAAIAVLWDSRSPCWGRGAGLAAWLRARLRS